MTLFELIKQETAGSRFDLILAAGLSGLANAGLLVLINTAIHDTSADGQDFRHLLIFAVALIIYAICFRRTTNRVTVVLEKILTTLRLRIAEKIRQTDLLSLERIDQAEIYNLLTSEARVISESSSMLAAALQSSILLLFAVIYMALLSLPAFIICLTLIGLLPGLAAGGKTIVAVTHDERYFHVAHRVVKMEFGRIVSITGASLQGGAGSDTAS